MQNPITYLTEHPCSTQSLSESGIAEIRAHYLNVVLPIWRHAGFNAAMGLPFEAISSEDHMPLPPKRYRAMACARQLFVFSEIGDLTHAATLFASLRRYFYDGQNGGWFYSVDENGAPLERQKDLYTHAFVVFACAHYARISGTKAAFDLVDETAKLIEARFATGDGLLNAEVSEDFSATQTGPLQNPLMHLAEAWLAAREATGDSTYDVRLAALLRSVARTFVDEATGCIAELPIGSMDNRIEPGHQFEWFFLCMGSDNPAFVSAGLDRRLARAFDFAERHGVDERSGAVYAALDESGSVIDSTQRIWAQTEYLRALATRGVAADVLGAQIERYRRRFLHARGWVESRSEDGAVSRADMPSTTAYHLATAYASLPR
ncbi:AGE family epimerase/isomerase [Caballeronia sp. EK]|uniref:AGE family epimerase/isomerase n=1 Tax=Caballeronia sp. EK TaxID=2767469 RepID=UPI0016565011|nr:AGE family epimerase/isomerase [Caballeronia sp. EK]MBC8638548.1 AGE family epimerase/isomerase [Caballeronia sp. EK]